MNKKINIFQNICLFCLVIFIVFFLIFINSLEISDELWNFQNICKMNNGLKIYVDANVIITPIFFYIANILFSILGANILTFRIYNIIIYVLIFGVMYKILKHLKFSRHLILVYMALIFEFIFSLMAIGANYNMIGILLVLIGLDLYITKKSTNLKQGILIFLIFFTKQNLGAIYALTIIIYELYLNKFTKKFIKDQFIKFFFFLMPTCLLFGYTYLQGYFFEFINFAFGGILDFGKTNNVFIAYGYYSLIPVIVLGLYIFVMIKRNTLFKDVLNKENIEILTLLFIFSMGTTLIVYPIMNPAHFTMVMPIYLTFLFYLFGNLMIESMFGEEKYLEGAKWITLAIVFSVALRVIFNMFEPAEMTLIKDKNSHLYGANISSEIAERSKKIEEYIKEKNKQGIEVLILSYDAVLPMINLKQSHGVYDLPFNGNLGYNGTEKLKQDIKSRENTEFLIFTEDEDLFWQESLEIREYIQENLECIGTLLNYSIYVNN